MNKSGICDISVCCVSLTDSGSPYLTEAQVSLIDNAECNSSIGHNGRISQDMLCAREMEAGSDMCHVRQNTGQNVFSLKGLKIIFKYKHQHKLSFSLIVNDVTHTLILSHVMKLYSGVSDSCSVTATTLVYCLQG